MAEKLSWNYTYVQSLCISWLILPSVELAICALNIKETGCLEGFHFQNYQKNLKFLEEQTKKPLLQLWGNRVLKYTCYNLCEPAGSKIKHLSLTQNENLFILMLFQTFMFFLLSVEWKVKCVSRLLFTTQWKWIGSGAVKWTECTCAL